MALLIEDELYIQMLGWEVLKYLKSNEEHLRNLQKEVNNDALRILEKIQRILNDDSLDDPDCFKRIELIVQTFYANHISTSRHDWG